MEIEMCNFHTLKWASVFLRRFHDTEGVQPDVIPRAAGSIPSQQKFRNDDKFEPRINFFRVLTDAYFLREQKSRPGWMEPQWRNQRREGASANKSSPFPKGGVWFHGSHIRQDR